MKEDVRPDLKSAISSIEKDFGKGAIMLLGEAQAQMGVEIIPTGCLALDVALGIGGLPRGRIVEMFGAEGSGKTTLAYHILAEAQKLGGLVAIVDSEHSLDPVYASAIGVDVNKLYMSQPDTAEEGLEIVNRLTETGTFHLVVVDSVAALLPRAELQGEAGDAHVGLIPRLMSQAMRKLYGLTKRTNTTVLFINQIREKIGVTYGPTETTPGGRALKFAASIRMDIRRLSSKEKDEKRLKDDDEWLGVRTKVWVVKNKLAPPFRGAEFDILYGRGIAREGAVLDAGMRTDVVTTKGAWYYYGDVRLGHGYDAAVRFLADNGELLKSIEHDVHRKTSRN